MAEARVDGGRERARLAFVAPYVGNWPRWLQLFLESCRPNPVVDVLLLSDARPPCALPDNVHLTHMSREEIFGRLERVAGVDLPNRAGHKLCDFKPFYGLAFADLLRGYEFWGYCDIDMMFGSLGKLLTDQFLQSVDIFTAHNEIFVGHFTILRNTPEINSLCFEIENWKERSLTPDSTHMDERGIVAAVAKRPSVRLKRPGTLSRELVRNFARCGITFGFRGEVACLGPGDDAVVRWENGSVYAECSTGLAAEALYIHFMGTKRWWHWLLFNSGSASQQRHYFSRIGYGGVRQPADLHRCPWRQLHRLQCWLHGARAGLTASVRRCLPRSTLALLRRVLRV